MNLVMKRMEETKKVRMRLRERQQQDEDERLKKKELEKKIQLDRISKNREWREKKRQDVSELSSVFGSNRKCVEWMVRLEMQCSECGEEMVPPGRIYQCHQSHNYCQHCSLNNQLKVESLIDLQVKISAGPLI